MIKVHIFKDKKILIENIIKPFLKYNNKQHKK